MISAIKYFFIGLFGLFLLAVIFGKKKQTKWEWEAKFFDGDREVGEFDFELSRFTKTEKDFTFHTEFKLRHPSIKRNLGLQVFLDDLLLVEGFSEKDGYARLTNRNQVNQMSDAPKEGQKCRVFLSDELLMEAPVYNDRLPKKRKP